ncbi:MAG: nucleotidyltransferase substrate binding protein [Oscillospiraceae bacterium]|nr:nucleotidyltransferase substrate binding protein [Oscillospiraceae bacterium]
MKQYRFYINFYCIHVFEITVESAWKMMQRWVKTNVDINIAQKPKRELFRIARDSGLIANAESWWGFYDARNITSHTYHEEIADEVYAIAKTFNVHIKDFIKRLEERL